MKNLNRWNKLAMCTFLAALSVPACVAEETGADLAPEIEEEIGEIQQGVSSAPCVIGGACAGLPITVTSWGASQYTATVNMAGYRRMDVFAKVCDPTGWTLHVADSPTANGYGGDAATTDFDAEGYVVNKDVHFFSTFDKTLNAIGAKVVDPARVPSACTTVRMTAFHASGAPDGTWSFQSSAAAPTLSVTSTRAMKIGYSACASATDPLRGKTCDAEQPGLADQSLWYVGVNRVVGGGAAASGRTGTGVSKACVVLSTLTTDVPPVPAACM